MTDQPVDDTAVAQALVRRYDRDRYWSALFAPVQLRGDLMTLYAFNVELSRVPEQVNEAMFGEVRLQWWRDALDLSTGGEKTGHPIADALAQTRLAHRLPVGVLNDMIDARMFDLSPEFMPDMPALRDYLGRTAGAVFKLACRITGAPEDRTTKACESAAMAYGITGLMRALPYHAARGRLFLPAEHFAANDIDPYALLRGDAAPQLDRALTNLRLSVRRHLAAFREEAANLPPETRPAFLPLVLIEPYLDALARHGHRPLQDIADLNPAARFWRIAKAYYTGVI